VRAKPFFGSPRWWQCVTLPASAMAETESTVSLGEVEPRRPSRSRSVITAFVGLACVLYLGRVLWSRRVMLGRAFDFDLGTIALLAGLVLLSHLLRAAELNFMLRRMRVAERFFDGFMLTGAALLLNYLPLSAGSVARAVALRRRYGLAYSSYVSALTLGALTNAAIASACGLFLCLAVLPRSGAVAPLVALCGIITVGAVSVIFVPASWSPRGSWLVPRMLRRVLERIAFIRGSGVAVIILGGMSAAKLALTSARLWLCFRTLGADLPVLVSGLLGSTSLLTSLVQLAPSNIGLRELVLGALAGVIGRTSIVGVAAASLERAILLGYSVAAGIPGIHYSRAASRTR
jgi:hypothetical protein